MCYFPATKNGYLYVYVSNETPNINVFFDNLQVTHIHGPLLQEQSYYPFGLEMAGISDEALGKLSNKNKFNGGVEIEEDYGVNLYSTFYRQYDPQIGRFNGVDCQSEASIGMSVYQFGANNPISYNDPLGDKQTAGYYSHPPGYRDYSLKNPNTSYTDVNGNSWHGDDPLEGASQWMDSGDDGGGGGAVPVDGGYSFTGTTAQAVFKDIQNAYNHPDNNGYAAIDFGKDVNGNIFDTYFTGLDSYSEMDNKSFGYKDQTVFFHQQTLAYLVAENNGLLTGAYRIDGYAQITHKTYAAGKYAEYFITIGVSGSTIAQLNGEVDWFGNAQLSVGGKVTARRNFENENINPEELNDPLRSYVGSVTFSLPVTDQNVQAIINVGYRLDTEQGNGGTPYPRTITHYINISH